MNNELPDDIELLKAMLRKQQSRLRQYACQSRAMSRKLNG
ncbi:putative transposase [Shigella flexneri SFJ17B]|nr:putative transposase [Shigella flexneri SFJ17B]